MPILQYLNNWQINDVVRESVKRHVPITITIRSDNRWVNFRSRAIASNNEHLWLELPIAEKDVAPHEFAPAEKIGLSFKLKHHKHITTVRVVGIRQMKLEDGCEVPVLAVCLPMRMQRLQRRAFERAVVPQNRIARISFWLGGRESEPVGPSEEMPVWFGRVKNLSAGGFQVRSETEVIENLEIGDTVGLHLSFGAGDDPIYADAQLRHIELAGGELLLGFQFVGLAHTVQGREALGILSKKVGEFHRIAAHGDTNKQAS